MAYAYAGNEINHTTRLTTYEYFKIFNIDLLLWIDKTPLENYKNSRFL